MPDRDRQLIRAMVSGDRVAAHAFVSNWHPRIEQWIASRTFRHKVDDYTQDVWLHLTEGNWLRLLQWRGLYDDEAYHSHSLDGFCPIGADGIQRRDKIVVDNYLRLPKKYDLLQTIVE